jgi:hypothetical protein
LATPLRRRPLFRRSPPPLISLGIRLFFRAPQYIAPFSAPRRAHPHYIPFHPLLSTFFQNLVRWGNAPKFFKVAKYGSVYPAPLAEDKRADRARRDAPRAILNAGRMHQRRPRADRANLPPIMAELTPTGKGNKCNSRANFAISAKGAKCATRAKPPPLNAFRGSRRAQLATKNRQTARGLPPIRAICLHSDTAHRSTVTHSARRLCQFLQYCALIGQFLQNRRSVVTR